MELCKEYKPISFNEFCEKINENFELDFQENLPQYLDDIDRVIKCSVNNTVTNYDITNAKLTVHGKTIVCVTYLNSDMCPMSNIFEEEFSKSIDLNNGDFVSFADIKLNTKYSNFRLINQRRIDVHTSLCLKINVFRKNTGKCMSNCKNAFVKEITVNGLIDKYAGMCVAEFDESFSVSDSNTQIKNIVNSNSICYLDETKIIKEKMLVKLRVETSLLYVSDSNSVEKCTHTFSLSKIIDVSDCDENDNALVSATISSIYVKSKTNSDNIINEFEIVGNVSINYQIYSTNDMSFVTDSYIPHFDTDIVKERLSIKQSPTYFYDDRSDELIFESDKNIIEIIDLVPSINNCSIKESTMILDVNLSFLYYDDASMLCYYEKSQELSFKLNDAMLDGEGVANLISYDFVIKSADKISLRINYTYRAYLYEFKSVDYLTDIQVSGEKNINNIPELTLYFANRNESIWDIAKKFSTDTSLIMEENNLSSEIIENKMVLLVPGM